ncbi:hypothetical protein GUJ93_ZPchr0001g30860 [Zizania palustris]|uniref:Uncharacterized protein n=1 Tax=Zizania palustris TaxID=103762 RepID=A0A8J5S9K5_ZIZPA|nr:hypothetical protein GUJ93_ZPchr0001g30860 [Zizania palustris]
MVRSAGQHLLLHVTSAGEQVNLCKCKTETDVTVAGVACASGFKDALCFCCYRAVRTCLVHLVAPIASLAPPCEQTHHTPLAAGKTMRVRAAAVFPERTGSPVCVRLVERAWSRRKLGTEILSKYRQRKIL